MKQLLFAALAVACTTALAQPATTVTVSPADMKGWAFFDDFAGTPCLPASVCAMVVGPATPAAGNGSARLKLVASNERPTLGVLLGQLAGKRFADLTALSYSTYKTTPNTARSLGGRSEISAR